MSIALFFPYIVQDIAENCNKLRFDTRHITLNTDLVPILILGSYAIFLSFSDTNTVLELHLAFDEI